MSAEHLLGQASDSSIVPSWCSAFRDASAAAPSTTYDKRRIFSPF